MRVIALRTFTVFENGQMLVLNQGDSGEMSDARALEYIEGGMAELAEPQPEPEPEPVPEPEPQPEPEAAAKPRKAKAGKSAAEAPVDAAP